MERINRVYLPPQGDSDGRNLTPPNHNTLEATVLREEGSSSLVHIRSGTEIGSHFSEGIVALGTSSKISEQPRTSE